MADEPNKPAGPPAGPPGAPPEGSGEKPAPPQPAAPAAKPPAPAAGAEKPAAPPKPAAPAKPAGPVPEPWDDDFSRRVRERLGAAILESQIYLGQQYFVADAASIADVCNYLKDDEQFDFLTDLTAVDYPKREKRFEVIYQLYSFPRNMRLRVKAPLGENETIETVTSIWSAANWLEREAYDMFGIRFSGHPDLKRILLPDDWQGYPLRKDYDILKQDTQWVQENLHIESGQ